MYSLIVIPILVGFLAQIIKLTIDGIPNNLNWQHIYKDYGGMPSAHTAFVASLATVVFLREGLDSAAFAVALILALVVIRDAVGFRREIGHNAVLTNMLAQEVFPNNPEVQVQERIGHSLKEVIAGLAVGIVFSLIFYWFLLSF